MSQYAFHPDRVIEQIHAFFHDVHEMTDFYYKLSLLNGLCRQCDGRGYLHAPDELCGACHGTGSTDFWRSVKATRNGA